MALLIRSLAPALAAGCRTLVKMPVQTAQVNALLSKVIGEAADLPKLEKAFTVFAGQFCMTGSRLLVQSGIAATVRQQLAERLTNVKVGPASDPASDMGGR